MTNPNDKKILIVVPLRRASVRVPEKIYADIHSQSLARRTVERVVRYAERNANVIACAAVDDIKTLGHLKEAFPKLEIVMTPPELNSGTDRVNSAFQYLVDKKNLNPSSISAVINLQGDMPFFSDEILESARQHFLKNPNFDGVWTAGHPFSEIAEIEAHQCVKALRSKSGRAVYFSRFAIPYSRAAISLNNASLCHIGIYAYSPQAIKTFCAAKPSLWEQSESLEQLRALELDLPFVIDEVSLPASNSSYRGIDTPEDLAWAQDFAKKLK